MKNLMWICLLLFWMISTALVCVTGFIEVSGIQPTTMMSMPVYVVLVLVNVVSGATAFALLLAKRI